MWSLQLISALFTCLIFFQVQSRTLYPQQKELPFAATCGYDSCPKPDPNKLNVHLIPHSHDDVGWLKTVDQYYYGARNNIQKAGVQYIIDTVIQELLADPSRRFIYVESAFFFKWWDEQSEETREKVKELVNSGRLEITGGAWSMNDEAATHYQSTIDQFAWGLRKLNDTFGACGRPRIGWQIDPFGHAREFASILTQIGYDGIFFARIDYQDKARRVDNKEMELIWRASNNIDSSDLFTSVLYSHYSPPPGFCFDINCNDEPIVDDKRSPAYNVEDRVNAFVTWAEQQHNAYRSKNILVTMGDDFQYQDAHLWYKNLDKLIKYINAAESKGINIFYSTPSCYVKAVNEENLSWTVKSDDFFPYGSDANSYWTGYFTSRPAIKYFERLGNNFLQVCKQLSAQSQLSSSDSEEQIASLREAMGILQHHDAITGTEKQHVAEDYARILNNAFESCSAVTEAALNKLSAVSSNSPQVSWKSCLLTNQSACAISEESTRFVVTVYNPLSHSVNRTIRLPVPSNIDLSVYNGDGNQLDADILPIPNPVLNLNGRDSTAEQELVFIAENLPPLGFRSFYVVREKGTAGKTVVVEESNENSIENNKNEVTFDSSSGEISIIKINGIDLAVKIELNYYEGATDGRSSGAYVFRPKDSKSYPVSTSSTVKVFKGRLVQEIQVVLNEWASQVIRLNRDDKEVEVNWLVGPIPIKDDIGKEVISKYTSNLASGGIFYTDSNGRELLKRQRDYRPTWQLDVHEPISGNYYPVVSQIGLRDDAKDIGLIVLTDRAEGGSSIQDGQLELMIHRRLLHDDGFGVGEALNETAFGEGLIVRGRQWLVAGSLTQHPTVGASARVVTQKNVLAPWIFLTSTELSLADWVKSYAVEKAGLNEALPQNIQILTLEPWKDNSILLRLEHILEKDEDSELSIPMTVDLTDLFTQFGVKSAEETTLDGNQWLIDSNRLSWTTTKKVEKENKKPKSAKALEITLGPMQIRTFVLYLA